MSSKLEILSKIKEIYDNGGNINLYLKSIQNNKINTVDDIMISYDFQAGTYTKYVETNVEYIDSYSTLLGKTINELQTNIESVIEVGCGEATMLANVIKNMNEKPKKCLGFDISWSRIYYATKYVKKYNIENVSLFTADLFNIPLPDSSVDIVYTSHSLESNGGNETNALKELYRVAKKYIVLLEPDYENASVEMQQRMDNFGYVKYLDKHAKDLGYEIIQNKPYGINVNPLNPTKLLIIKKNSSDNESNDLNFQCPITKTVLKGYDNYFYSDEGLLSYPILKNIPCLLPSNAILSTRLNDF